MATARTWLTLPGSPSARDEVRVCTESRINRAGASSPSSSGKMSSTCEAFQGVQVVVQKRGDPPWSGSGTEIPRRKDTPPGGRKRPRPRPSAAAEWICLCPAPPPPGRPGPAPAPCREPGPGAAMPVLKTAPAPQAPTFGKPHDPLGPRRERRAFPLPAPHLERFKAVPLAAGRALSPPLGRSG